MTRSRLGAGTFALLSIAGLIFLLWGPNAPTDPAQDLESQASARPHNLDESNSKTPLIIPPHAAPVTKAPPNIATPVDILAIA